MTAVRPTHPAWNQTHCGVAFDFLRPNAAMIRDGDVAQALGQINRFNGNLIRPYSVAQHSVLVVELLLERGISDPHVLLQGLVHDSHEAVVGDVTGPLKALLSDFQAIETRVWAVYAGYFGVPAKLHPEVSAADWAACCLEAHAHYQVSPLWDWAGVNRIPQLGESTHAALFRIRDPQAWSQLWLRALYFLREAVQRGSLVLRLGLL